jgi:hypothetical protein
MLLRNVAASLHGVTTQKITTLLFVPLVNMHRLRVFVYPSVKWTVSGPELGRAT